MKLRNCKLEDEAEEKSISGVEWAAAAGTGGTSGCRGHAPSMFLFYSNS